MNNDSDLSNLESNNDVAEKFEPSETSDESDNLLMFQAQLSRQAHNR